MKCAQCGHENDLTRAFCQNCGVRLERAPGEDPRISGPTNVPAGPQKRSRPSGARFGGTALWVVGRILTSAILGALLAALIQMGRQPDGVPAAQPANEAQAGQLLEALQTSAESTYARAVEVTQAQANNYLAASIIADSAATGKVWQADFGRAFVLIKSGQLDFLVEQRFHGWPIYMYLTTVPETSGGKSTLKITGGGVGRMPLSLRLVPLLERALHPVIASTSEAAAVLETADDVVLAPSVAKLSWRARKPVTP